MRSQDDAAIIEVRAHPILHILAAFPIACFTGALATDVAYWSTARMMWADFSAWLLAAGFGIGILAAVAGVVEVAVRRRRRDLRPAWEVVVGTLLVLVLAGVDNLVHSRDAWTSVVPTGLVLSAGAVIVTLATAWIGFGGGQRRIAASAASPVAAPVAGAHA